MNDKQSDKGRSKHRQIIIIFISLHGTLSQLIDKEIKLAERGRKNSRVEEW